MKIENLKYIIDIDDKFPETGRGGKYSLLLYESSQGDLYEKKLIIGLHGLTLESLELLKDVFSKIEINQLKK